jgi:undecaprenyl diphosphate synthase
VAFSQEAYEAYFADAPDDVDVDGLDLRRVPRHIAVIMDGNGRWAQRRNLDRGYGHAAGVSALKEVITACVRLGVGALTVYAFSTENWNRPKEEVDLLMSLFASTLIDELPLMHREDVRLKYLGDMDELPDDTRATFERGLSETAGHTGLTLAVAVNYGSRAEIARAARILARRCTSGEMDPGQIDEQSIERELYTFPLPDPDLLIRTSGEQRLSNFLLWQLSYTEMVFTDVLWPDFDRWDLMRAILTYQRRHRRFGGVSDDE